MSLEHALNDWYAVADAATLEKGDYHTRLLGVDLTVSGTIDAPVVTDSEGHVYPTQFKFSHVWTTLGDAPRPLFDIPEGDEPELKEFLAKWEPRTANDPREDMLK